MDPSLLPGIGRGDRPHNPQHVAGWRCELKIIPTADNPYGRVSCRLKHASFSFRGL